jgi:hypothetical protein
MEAHRHYNPPTKQPVKANISDKAVKVLLAVSTLIVLFELLACHVLL